MRIIPLAEHVHWLDLSQPQTGIFSSPRPRMYMHVYYIFFRQDVCYYCYNVHLVIYSVYIDKCRSTLPAIISFNHTHMFSGNVGIQYNLIIYEKTTDCRCELKDQNS